MKRVELVREETCAGLPQEFLLKAGIRSCYECDRFRELNAKANFTLRQEEQRDKRRYHCRIRSSNYVVEKRKLPLIKIKIVYMDTDNDCTEETEGGLPLVFCLPCFPPKSTVSEISDCNISNVFRNAGSLPTPTKLDRRAARPPAVGNKRPLSDDFLTYCDKDPSSILPSTPEADTQHY
jgi:hypothetical protein